MHCAQKLFQDLPKSPTADPVKVLFQILDDAWQWSKPSVGCSFIRDYPCIVGTTRSHCKDLYQPPLALTAAKDGHQKMLCLEKTAVAVNSHQLETTKSSHSCTLTSGTFMYFPMFSRCLSKVEKTRCLIVCFECHPGGVTSARLLGGGDEPASHTNFSFGNDRTHNSQALWGPFKPWRQIP